MLNTSPLPPLCHVSCRIAYSDREKLLETFFPKELEIHWLSIVNSIVLVILLLGFIVLILVRGGGREEQGGSEDRM